MFQDLTRQQGQFIRFFGPGNGPSCESPFSHISIFQSPRVFSFLSGPAEDGWKGCGWKGSLDSHQQN